jgi:hypothetical protein
LTHGRLAAIAAAAAAAVAAAAAAVDSWSKLGTSNVPAMSNAARCLASTLWCPHIPAAQVFFPPQVSKEVFGDR